METTRICHQCRQPLPDNAPEGLCFACLARIALDPAPTGAPSTINVTPLAEAAPGPRVAPTPAELAGQFPQLEILELLGMGGMGIVYKARQPRLDRLVALKILPLDSAARPSFAERFNREARALARLNHPGIVAVFDFGQTSQYYYLVMEYVDGMNLRQLLQTQPLDPRQALELVTGICTALQFAHDEGVVHRDIKPENILLNKKGQVKVADFGLAKLLGAEPDTALTMSQATMGTFNYMAPEQRENAQKVDHRADIYSLGVVFYEMLTGEVPMGRFEPPSSSPRGVQVDVRLDEVVLRALERKPERRYQQASQVKTAVESIVGTPAGGAAAARSPAPAPAAAPAAVSVPETLLTRDYHLRIRHCLRRGWALVKADFWPTVGVTTLMVALLELTSITLNQLGAAAKGSGVGLGVLQVLLTAPMLAGLSYYFLKKIRREPATAETAFAGYRHRFLQLFLGNLVMLFLVGLGFACLILPGIYLLVAWGFALILILDKGMDFWPALELSRRLIHRQWWRMFAFLLVMMGLCIAGVLCLGVGLLVAMPVTFAAFMYCYEDIVGDWTPPNNISTPARVSEVPGPSAEADGNPAKAATQSVLPMIGLILAGGALAAVGIAIAVYEKNWKIEHSSPAYSQHSDGTLSMPPSPRPPATSNFTNAPAPTTP
jgi:tRNA A-37 threonylcarbamoyl transferase component Bud32